MTLVSGPEVLAPVLDGIGAELERWTVPGLELAVVQRGEAIFAGGFGFANVETAARVTSSTYFDHGSCGKAFTSLLAVVLADDGLVDLDVPVRTYVPELRLPDSVIAERATLRDLLSHRSGLDRHDLAWIYNPSWSREECVRRLAQLSLVGDLRAQWSYSNFGYTLAGLAMERATGIAFEELVEKRVLQAAGMARATVSDDRVEADADHAKPYRLVDGVAVPTDRRRMPGTLPAGGVKTCADDSVRWLLLQLGHGPIAPDVVRRTQHPQVAIPDMPYPYPEIHLYGYGLGWVVSTYRGRHALWHTGGVDGFFTYTLLLPEEGIGAISSANRLDTALPQAVVHDVVDALLGERGEQPWVERMRADAAPAPAAPAPRQAQAVSPAPPAHALDAYVGRFSNGGYGDLVVRLVGGELVISVGEFAQVTTHRLLDAWDIHYVALGSRGTVAFFTDAEGVVAEAVVTFEQAPQPVRYVRVQDGVSA